ncbi:hypothetical protein BC829DRAFT_112871 [Chytridium lagenaria]|nr:hypothetical protein BC829DRAFT_112871 [Chytridium lagenaria]
MPESPEKKDKKEKKEKKKWNLFGWNTKEEEEEVVETALEKTQRELEGERGLDAFIVLWNQLLTDCMVHDRNNKPLQRQHHKDYRPQHPPRIPPRKLSELEAAVQQQKSTARSLSWKGWMAKNKCILITSGVMFFVILIITIIIIISSFKPWRRRISRVQSIE